MTTRKIKVENKILTISHPDKILFPNSNITKWNLVDYYFRVSDLILPFIKNRPITINCFRNGINNEGFYRQHAPENLPGWFQTIELIRKKGGKINHILCQNSASLIYLVNQNMIAIHRWLSVIEKPEQPEILIVDIDPPKGMFDIARIAAKLVKAQLEALDYKAYLMTTGSKGLHVISKAKHNDSFERIRTMLHSITSQLANEHPKYFSINIKKCNRTNLVYLDISRNAYGQTAISPFSVRAIEGGPIATPITWQELEDKDLTSTRYNMDNIFARLKGLKDNPWHGY